MSRLIICAFLMLTGCAAAPGNSVEFASSRHASLLQQSASQNLASREVGDLVQVEGVNYSVVADYQAASGRRCKKLQNQTLSTFRVACQSTRGSIAGSAKGEWYLRKPLFKPMAARQQPAMRSGKLSGPAQATLSPAMAEPLAGTALMSEARSFRLLPGETLWRFSRRVTGNATNWQAIASFNNISEVATVKAGQQLNVPPELVISADGS